MDALQKPGLPKNLQLVFRRIGEQLEAYYRGPCSGALVRTERDDEELFMLLVYADSLGIPNPVSLYAPQPQMLERFHQWHRRVGIERSPLDEWRCC